MYALTDRSPKYELDGIPSEDGNLSSLGQSVRGPIGASHWGNQLPDLNFEEGSRSPGTA